MSEKFRMKYSIVALTPYFSELQLKTIQERIRVLELLNFIFLCSENAIKLFSSEKYREFDAQVSENLCQIRGYQLIDFIISNNCLEKKRDLENFLNTIKNAQKRCREALIKYYDLRNKRPSYYTKLIDETISLIEMLVLYEFDLTYSELFYFITQSYILSKYKLVGDFDISYGINYDALCCDIKIQSKTFVRKIIHCFQRNISKLSCQFIFKMAGIDPNFRNVHILKLLYHTDEVGRHVLSCYEVTRIILNHALATKKRVKIIAIREFNNIRDEIEFLLKPDLEKGYYIYSTEESNETNEIMVFKGRVTYDKSSFETKEQYIKRFLCIGFIEVIQSNMAQHPQYAGILLSEFKFNPYASLNFDDVAAPYIETLKEAEQQFLEHKRKAEQYGCVPNNPTLFLLTHIYCDNNLSNSAILHTTKEESLNRISGEIL